MKNILKRFEDLMTAITFAEAGDAETARQFLGSHRGSEHQECEVCGYDGKQSAALHHCG